MEQRQPSHWLSDPSASIFLQTAISNIIDRRSSSFITFPKPGLVIFEILYPFYIAYYKTIKFFRHN